MARISLHYWAGARAAAGVEEETVSAPTVADALAQVVAYRDERFARVIAASSLLIDGLTAHPVDLEQFREDDVRVEVLPPFAGGAGEESPTGPRR